MEAIARLIASSSGRGHVESTVCEAETGSGPWVLSSSTVATRCAETRNVMLSTSSATSRLSKCATSRSGQASSLIAAMTHNGAVSLKTQGAKSSATSVAAPDTVASLRAAAYAVGRSVAQLVHRLGECTCAIDEPQSYEYGDDSWDDE